MSDRATHQPIAASRFALPQREWSTVAAFVRAARERHGDRDAVISPTERLTFGDLDERSASLARGLLARGIAKYARVAFMMPNSPGWAVTWLAIARIGAVAVPLSTFATPHELRRMLAHSDCAALLVDVPDDDELVEAVLDTDAPALEVDGKLYRPDLPHLRWIATRSGALPRKGVRSLASVHADGNLLDDALLSAAEREVHACDPATMIYTSGSTSDPKGVVHSHDGVLTKTAELAHEFSYRPDDRVYTSMPFFWVGGIGMVLLPTLAAGGCVATLARPVPSEVSELIERERLTRVFLYPPRTMLAVSSNPSFADADLSSVERGIPRPDRGDEWNFSFTTHEDTMGLGMSETFTAYSWGAADDVDRFTPPLTRLSEGWEMKVLTDRGEPAQDGEQGEILVRGPSLTVGLQKTLRRDSFDADGFYRTGDLGLVDGPRVRFRGRRGDVIKTSGANVSAAEVVAALLELDEVQDAVVVGYPDAERGAVPGAVVVTSPGADVSEHAIRAALEARMASYKVPKRIIVASSHDEIPMTATGKVRQHELRQRFMDLADEPS
jgi:acyl-CoA synthetase (AMP-forming)/AMP-acid ligase II